MGMPSDTSKSILSVWSSNRTSAAAAVSSGYVVMAHSASETLPERVSTGIVCACITPEEKRRTMEKNFKYFIVFRVIMGGSE